MPDYQASKYARSLRSRQAQIIENPPRTSLPRHCRWRSQRRQWASRVAGRWQQAAGRNREHDFWRVIALSSSWVI